jgi:hypothetical protein
VTRTTKLGNLLVLCALGLSVPSCRVASQPSIKLDVPFRTQIDNGYCGPASVLMWRLYDGRGEISQETIGNFIGCTTAGSSAQAIANGVNQFTDTRDAYWDLAGGLGDYDLQRAELFSRQITSIDAGTPVIAVVEGGFHAGVVNGGKWHTDTTTGLKMWDFVFFHDPDPHFGGANKTWGARSWTNSYVASQVISAFASRGSATNFDAFGNQIGIRGRDWPPPGDWPPAI